MYIHVVHWHLTFLFFFYDGLTGLGIGLPNQSETQCQDVDVAGLESDPVFHIQQKRYLPVCLWGSVWGKCTGIFSKLLWKSSCFQTQRLGHCACRTNTLYYK